jgi:hypothetical protein
MAKILSIRKTKMSWKWLSGALLVVVIALPPFVAGCSDEDPVVCVGGEDTPPFPPDGVFSITGNKVVTIYWNANWEEDLAGYAVFRNDQPDGYYTHIADVDWDAFCDDQNSLVCYDDTNLNNGQTYFYAVLAFDEAGNESDLSFELVHDTPRPEGTNLELYSFMGQNSDQSGYDFSSLTGAAQPDTSSSTDIYFGVEGTVNTIFTSRGDEVMIQDYGLIDLEGVDWAPKSGWAPSGRAEAIIGHSYIVQIQKDGNPGAFNYAKIFVSAVSPTLVRLDWAYQPSDEEVYGNRELTPLGGGASR